MVHGDALTRIIATMNNAPPTSSVYISVPHEYGGDGRLTESSLDGSELTGPTTSSDDDNGIDNHAADPYYFHTVKGTRCAAASQAEAPEVAALRLQLVRQQENYDGLSSTLAERQIENETLNSLVTELTGALAANTNKEGRQRKRGGLLSAPAFVSSNQYNTSSPSAQTEGGPSAAASATPTEKYLMAENARLKITIDVMRKSFQSHRMKHLTCEQSEVKIKELERTNEKLMLKLRGYEKKLASKSSQSTTSEGAREQQQSRSTVNNKKTSFPTNNNQPSKKMSAFWLHHEAKEAIQLDISHRSKSEVIDTSHRSGRGWELDTSNKSSRSTDKVPFELDIRCASKYTKKNHNFSSSEPCLRRSDSRSSQKNHNLSSSEHSVRRDSRSELLDSSNKSGTGGELDTSNNSSRSTDKVPFELDTRCASKYTQKNHHLSSSEHSSKELSASSSTPRGSGSGMTTKDLDISHRSQLTDETTPLEYDTMDISHRLSEDSIQVMNSIPEQRQNTSGLDLEEERGIQDAVEKIARGFNNFGYKKQTTSTGASRAHSMSVVMANDGPTDPSSVAVVQRSNSMSFRSQEGRSSSSDDLLVEFGERQTSQVQDESSSRLLREFYDKKSQRKDGRNHQRLFRWNSLKL